MRRALLSALAGAFIWAGCDTGLPAGSNPHHEFNFLDMMDQPRIKPQRADLFGAMPNGMMQPPPGAVAIDEHPYRFAQAEAEQAGQALRNPLARDPKVLKHGKFVFDNICITCHGPKAAGDGHLTKVFPSPPSLMTQKVRSWPDGRIYHIVMRGQGSMPSHATQLEPRDIWSVIHHIRTLQAELPVAPPPAAPVPGGKQP